VIIDNVACPGRDRCILVGASGVELTVRLRGSA